MRKQRHAIDDVEACPVEAALDIMGGKWKGAILFRLADGPVRFNTLQRLLCRITARSLTQQLREMERDGLVHRTIHPEVPPRVDYALTAMGQSLVPIIARLHAWSEEHILRRPVQMAPLPASPPPAAAEPGLAAAAAAS
jgi:DNA-binding HxlR family transcriptional regulator